MRRAVRGVAWLGLVLLVTLVGAYVGLVLLRRVSPPIVPVDAANALPGYSTGDGVLLRDVPVADLVADDVVAGRRVGSEGGGLVLGRVLRIDQDGSQSTVVLAGTGAGEEVGVPRARFVGRADGRVPLAGWPLLALRQRVLQVLLGLVVLGIVLLLVLGRSPLGSPVVTPPAAMPYGGPPMSITPDDLRQVRFAQTRKGYDTEAVDRALDTVADSLEQLLAERSQLIERLRTLEGEVERYKAMESQLGQTLAMAEKSAEQVKADAQAEAARILAEAQAPAAAAPAAPAAAAQPPEGAMVELLGETRAIRSLLQAVLTQNGQLGAPAPQAPHPGFPPHQQQF